MALLLSRIVKYVSMTMLNLPCTILNIHAAESVFDYRAWTSIPQKYFVGNWCCLPELSFTALVRRPSLKCATAV